MNTLVKTAVAGALALGATSAFAVGVPSTNSSDLILYVDALSAGGSSVGVYAVDTGVSLSSLMPGGFVSGAANNSTAFAGITKNLSTPGLSSFVSTATSQGETIGWTLEGAQYSGLGTWASGTTTSASNDNSGTPGSALAIFTSTALTTNQKQGKVSTATTVAFQDFLNGLQNDILTGGLTGLSPANGNTATETTGTQGLSAPSKYGFFGGADLSANDGSSITLFGFTANQPGTTALQSYVLGTATLSATGVLQINPNAPTTAVPLPAAVWLFGSGLMGLVGVSRRRKAETAV